MKYLIRTFFVLFIFISVGLLLLYNHGKNSSLEGNDAYMAIMNSPMVRQVIADQVTVIIYIFVMVSVCILYLVYEFYRVIYTELADRMEMLDASRNDLQTTYDSVAMLMIEIDRELNIININNAFAARSGRKKNSIIGQKLSSMLKFHESSMTILTDKIGNVFSTNKNERIEIEEVGQIFEAFIFPLKASKESTGKVLLMLNDVTNARAVERQMLQDNKMIAVGQLAAGVAHEIRNPLGIIRNYCYVLKNSGEFDRAVIEKAIASIEKAVDKSGRIIDNLLDFSRISNNKREVLNLNKFLSAIISLEQNILDGKKVSVSLNCDESIEINTVAESLEIILINLIINAVDAMPHGGSIRISAAASRDMLQISVSDTGSGIPEENLASIFNPFFTTKEKRDGSGLGLYIVYNETEKLGGKIEVDSKLGSGTTFTLIFSMQRSGDDDQQAIQNTDS